MLFIDEAESLLAKRSDNSGDARREIWEQHIRGNGIHVPLADDVDTHELAEKFEFCGREIKKAVRDACLNTAIHGRNTVTQSDFTRACLKILQEAKDLSEAEDYSSAKKNSLRC